MILLLAEGWSLPVVLILLNTVLAKSLLIYYLPPGEDSPEG